MTTLGESSRDRWERKVDFAARRLADFYGKDWERLPQNSRWFASKVRYRQMATLVLGAGNLWEIIHDDKE